MSVYELDGIAPQLPDNGDYWIAPDANVIGDVRMGAGCSIWFGSTLRGDNEPITLGDAVNIQENCVLHTDPGSPVDIGDDCTIGHSAIIHGCRIGAGSLIGMGATVLNGAKIGRRTLVGAGALITEGKEIPDGVLVVGRPGKVVRELSDDEIEGLMRSAERYRRNGARFRDGLTPA